MGLTLAVRAVMFMHGKIMTIYQVDVDEKMELNLVWPHTELWRCAGVLDWSSERGMKQLCDYQLH